MALSPYDLGITVHAASQADPRFSYSLYVPSSAVEPGSRPQLIVAVHGTGRNFEETLQSLADFARWHNCIVLCPLFPAGVRGDRNLHGYKYLIEGDIRYDKVLIDMIDEVAARYDRDFSRFVLAGFSGGAHFVHRFLLLHPERLLAAAIGAPGSVTLLDQTRRWWVGTADFEALFGKPIALDAIRKVNIHMSVGAVDLETWEINHKPGAAYWMEGANDAGLTRPERLKALKTSFEQHDIPATFNLMNGAAHDERRYYNELKDFLRTAIAQG